MLHDVVQRKKFYTLVLQKCLTRSNLTSFRTEMALHREIKTNLPDYIKAGSRIIPKGREHHINFYPKDDLPHYAIKNYGNGRAEAINQRKIKNERGYWNRNYKK